MEGGGGDGEWVVSFLEIGLYVMESMLTCAITMTHHVEGPGDDSEELHRWACLRLGSSPADPNIV